MMNILNRITNNAKTGDLVRCCNCEKVMLVDIGEEICPECHKNGTMQWIDEEQEHNIVEIPFLNKICVLE